MWDLYFTTEKGAETEKWGLYNYQSSFAGWGQAGHDDLIKPFEDKFFEQIGQIIATKGRSVGEAYYHGLSPDDPACVSKYETYLADVQSKDPDNTFLIKALKDSIT
jgi:hypothetical protein